MYDKVIEKYSVSDGKLLKVTSVLDGYNNNHNHDDDGDDDNNDDYRDY